MLERHLLLRKRTSYLAALHLVQRVVAQTRLAPTAQLQPRLLTFALHLTHRSTLETSPFALF